MNISPDKKIYFLSDFHLGAPDAASSLVREKKIVAFLESIRHDAAMVFIVGDIFDFWFEYTNKHMNSNSAVAQLSQLTQ